MVQETFHGLHYKKQERQKKEFSFTKILSHTFLYIPQTLLFEFHWKETGHMSPLAIWNFGNVVV